MDPTTVTEVTTAALAAVSAAPLETTPMDVAKAVYIFCMVGGFLWLLLTAFVGPLIGEFGGAADSDPFGLAGDIHFSPMSPSVISAFTAAFGCGGLFSMGIFHLTSLQALPVALGTGAVVGAVIYYFVRHIFMNVQGGVEAPAADLIGVEAEVTTGIPSGGIGEIAYVSGAGRQSSPARTEDGAEAPIHSVVEIVAITGPHKVVRIKSNAEPKPTDSE